MSLTGLSGIGRYGPHRIKLGLCLRLYLDSFNFLEKPFFFKLYSENVLSSLRIIINYPQKYSISRERDFAKVKKI